MNLSNSDLIASAPVALITGGSSGIGLATARLMASQGYRIAVCGRDSNRLQQAAETIDNCWAIRADLNNPHATGDIVDSTITHFGQIDVLVNNAAFAPLAPFDEISPEIFEQAVNTNIRSVFYLTQHIWRIMKRQGRGVVVNISSLAAVDPFPGFSLYGSSKAWLDIVTKALASEGEEIGIRVYSIRPGAVETPMLRGLFPDFPADQCVSPEQVAIQIWNCINDPDNHDSGDVFVVTNQKGVT